MSILIKGMEMPESCYYCPFADGSWGYSPPNQKRCLINGKDMPVDERFVQQNQVKCPLIELPPHGRLIDADALRVDYFAPSSTSNMPNYYHVSKAQIDNAPTIIESEGEDG